MTWLLPLLWAPLWASAQSNGPWEKASLQIGGFFASSSTDLRLDSKTLGVGTVVNLEDTLGLDTGKTTYRIDAFYRPGSSRRHQLEFHYYNLRRTGDKVLDNTIQVGDLVFPAGTGLNSEFKLQFVNVDYSYAFFQDNRVRLAVAGGVHTTGVKLKMTSTGGALAEDTSFTAPLPVLGLRGDVVLAERWRLKGSADAFYLAYSGSSGSLTDVSLALEYLAFRNVGFGLGLNNVRIQLKADADNNLGLGIFGQLTYNFTGAMLYVKGYF
jgi:hypothetical protein